jgi:hypothetical protein
MQGMRTVNQNDGKPELERLVLSAAIILDVFLYLHQDYL